MLHQMAGVLIGVLALGLADGATSQRAQPQPHTPARFLDLVNQYRQGDSDSLAEAARWAPREVERAAGAARTADQATARAALVFTIDLARRAPVPAVPGFVEASRVLAEAVAGTADDSFRHEVVVAQVACLTHAEAFERAHWLLGSAFRTWPGDADLLLARGSIYEAIFARRFREWIGNGWAEQYESLALERAAALATADFERLLATRTPPPEALLRLGRLLGLRQKYADASRWLERARDDADHEYVRYLASLFLGQILERTGHGAEAEAAFRAAYREYPGAQAVTLSLAHLLMRRGARTEADALLLAMFQARGASTDVPDPWRSYDYGQFWRLGERLERLRAQVR